MRIFFAENQQFLSYWKIPTEISFQFIVPNSFNKLTTKLAATNYYQKKFAKFEILSLI